ncbi:unnamed protein product, partial [Sphenostylis stenocarpa]
MGDTVGTPFSLDNNSSTFSGWAREAIFCCDKPQLGFRLGFLGGGFLVWKLRFLVLNGELQNLQASDEDLYGADLHLQYISTLPETNSQSLEQK